MTGSVQLFHIIRNAFHADPVSFFVGNGHAVDKFRDCLERVFNLKQKMVSLFKHCEAGPFAAYVRLLEGMHGVFQSVG